MRFNFKIQQYQTEAVDSVVRVFNGQPYYERAGYIRDLGKMVRKRNFKDQFEGQMGVDLEGAVREDWEDIDDTAFRNEDIQLSDEQLLRNIREIQSLNNMKQSGKLVNHLGRCSLDVEMETGTGKTYVYIKTMFELNKRYGWSKFIVVVPSIAIREGVYKSFEITQEHFMEKYGKKARFFIYNSSDLNRLDSFSSNSGINVMIINTQAFASSLKEGANNKESRIIYSKRDEFASRRPIDVIKANRPIVILDEPQKMGGAVTQKALQNFNPLFCLNYSATHKEQHNLVYVLDALDAYNKRLVKKIEVKGFEVKNFRGTEGYLYLESIVVSPKHAPRARIEFERNYQKSINREAATLDVGDNLYYKSAGKHMPPLEQYKGYVISEIDPIMGTVTFTNGEVIHKGDVVGDISERDIRRIQIRETILSHFEKEEQLFNKGIKTLSLFFIDEVARYRQYDDEGNELLGEYGRMFEEEYLSVLNEQKIFNSEYREYLNGIHVHDTHKGYFSIDKKGRAVNSAVKRGSEFSDDISAYDLILKNKERLLSFEEPARFIFSHSALREGWDNPNIFQICTLKHGGDSAAQKRQEVGRGLRLCVDRQGNRMDGETCGDDVHDINALTVIASEGYASFVSALQSDMKENLHDRPMKADKAYFAGQTVRVGEGNTTITDTQAGLIYRYLIKYDYIDERDHITPSYHEDLKKHCLAPLPEALRSLEEEVHALIQGIFDEHVLKHMIEDGNKTKVISNPLNDNFYKKEFQTLWGYINHKYAYKVDFDSEELIRKAVESIDRELFVSELQYTLSKGFQRENVNRGMVIGETSFYGAETETKALKHTEISRVKYDLVGKVAEGTALTRKTAAAILQGMSPAKFAMFKNNPEEFIAKVIRLINEQKAAVVVEHISYDQIEGEYDSLIFTAEKHSRGIEKAFRAVKHIQDYVFTDGTAEKSVERRFAEDLDVAGEVCVYAKLPRGFKIPTPVGNYSPDWAIAFEEGTVKHIFFVAETKGTMESLNLRPIEKAKIDCAKKLFTTLSGGYVVYDHVDSYQQLLNKVMGS
ncbi:type III restriction-modification system endonuclease [Lacrimispora sp.]|uniref:type III restriction-modification system endonuclease n=1 Tax=Lacrimispora sp. TaxID=2719234 RepID=UPI0034603EC1